MQARLAQITWYHHISMLPKIKDLTLRAFYMTEASIQGWSRAAPRQEKLQETALLVKIRKTAANT